MVWNSIPSIAQLIWLTVAIEINIEYSHFLELSVFKSGEDNYNPLTYNGRQSRLTCQPALRPTGRANRGLEGFGGPLIGHKLDTGWQDRLRQIMSLYFSNSWNYDLFQFGNSFTCLANYWYSINRWILIQHIKYLYAYYWIQV